MEALYSNPKVSTPIIDILATFVLACSTMHIYERADTWIKYHFVHEILANVLHICMCAEDRSPTIAATECRQKQHSRKLQQSFFEEVEYLLKRSSQNQAVVEYDASVLKYMRLLSMTLQQYTDNPFSKSCKVADIYDGSEYSGVFFEDGNSSIRHSHDSFLMTRH